MPFRSADLPSSATRRVQRETKEQRAEIFGCLLLSCFFSVPFFGPAASGLYFLVIFLAVVFRSQSKLRDFCWTLAGFSACGVVVAAQWAFGRDYLLVSWALGAAAIAPVVKHVVFARLGHLVRKN
jgi:hypothetical protein